MSTFKVTIGDKTHEVSASDIKATEEGYGVVTPDNVPEGYFTQNAMEQKIKDRLKSATSNAKDQLKDDESFHKEILNKYNVALDADGKPKGLKPTVDVDEVKQQAAESVKQEYEGKLNNLKGQLNQFKQKGLRSSIVEGANSINIDGQYLEPLVEGGSPYLVKELEDDFAYNEEIGDYALVEKTSDGQQSFAVDGNGFVTVGKFFEKNAERFKHMQKDNRQRGSKFNGPSTGANGSVKGNPAKWDLAQKNEFIRENGQDGYKEAVRNYQKEQKAKED